MVEFLKEKINIEIFEMENGVTEIIIRGEEKYKNYGFKVNVTEESLNVKDFIKSIENMTYKKVKSFLEENGINYNNCKFL